MYCLVPEKPLRLLYGTFYLAIRRLFKDFLRNHQYLGFAQVSVNSQNNYLPKLDLWRELSLSSIEHPLSRNQKPETNPSSFLFFFLTSDAPINVLFATRALL